MLLQGYITNDQVRAAPCTNCKQTTQALTINYGNPNLLLFGCKDTKCKHRLLRFDFAEMAKSKLAAKS